MRAILALAVIAVFYFFNSCKKDQSKSSAINVQRAELSKEGKAPGNDLLPDLTIDGDRLASSVVIRTKVFKSDDCVVVEGCAFEGKRKLMRFDVATPNIGTADLFLGDPAHNPLFEWSPCHGHYHFSGYAKYELLNSLGTTILIGRKQAFCLEDFARYDPNAGPPKYNCSYQGISVGWQDIYGSYLDCQWLDITGIPSGNYMLRVTINPERLITESNYDNNSATVPVTIGK